MSKEIILTPLTENDLELVRGWRNSEEVSKYMYTDDVITPEQQEKWYKNSVKNNESCKYWIIENNGQKIGLASINNIDLKNKKCSWAFYLGETNLKGGGIGSIVEYKVIEYVFNELKLNKLCCEVFDFNKPVLKLHKKFGFIEEGILGQHIFKNGEFLNVYVLALFADVWKENKTKIESLLTRI